MAGHPETEIVLRPSAARLVDSMRDIGYSFRSALADIVDNSISAGAREIQVLNDIDDSGAPFVAIIDDGHGMSEVQLTAAMRHGSRSPREVRELSDLGRFGLGLKTASFSQCRRLTVVSRVGGEVSARQWDLDRIVADDEWTLACLPAEAISQLPLIETMLPSTGTIVLWQGMDRLDALGDAPDALLTAMNRIFGEATPHLGLVFHRFIAPDAGSRSPAVRIVVNGNPLVAADPFAQRTHAPSDAHERETIVVEGGEIHVQAFTLPHHTRMSVEDNDTLSMGSTLVETQGLYIYRGMRLISWGDWLGLARRSAITKLIRVRVDVTTALDSEWMVDVRKSRIRPPAIIRQRLKPLVDRMTESGKRPYTWRGERQVARAGIPLWTRVTDRDRVRYEINRDHPLVRALVGCDTGNDATIDSLLVALQAGLPLEAMFSDYGSAPQRVSQSELDDASLRAVLAAFMDSLEPGSDQLSAASVTAICNTHPFTGDSRVLPLLADLRTLDVILSSKETLQ